MFTSTIQACISLLWYEWMNEWMKKCIYIAPVKQKSSEALVASSRINDFWVFSQTSEKTVMKSAVLMMSVFWLSPSLFTPGFTRPTAMKHLCFNFPHRRLWFKFFQLWCVTKYFTLHNVPRTRSPVHYHPHIFRATTSQIWSTLPSHISDRNISREQFKLGLKTWLFVQAYT